MIMEKKKLRECDCLSKVEETIKKRFATEKEKMLNGYKFIDGSWECHSFYPKFRLYSNYTIKSSFEKKDGTESKPKIEHVSIFYSYCPFCGKKYQQRDEVSMF